MHKRAYSEARVIRLDAAPGMLAIALREAQRAVLDVLFARGMAGEPAFETSSFERVVSSLLFHHLGAEEKHRTLRAVRALLGVGGELHVADWGEAGSPGMRVVTLEIQLLDGFAPTSDNVRGLLPRMMEEAGLNDVAETHREATVFGTLSLYRARRP